MRCATRSPFCLPVSALLYVPSFFGFIFLLITLPAEGSQADPASIRSKAATQHEIVMILLQKKEFDQAANEACKIFELNWPPTEEPVLLTEMQILSKKFQDDGQTALAMRLLDTNMKSFKATKSQIWLWKEKGYLYKKMGQNDKALECFRSAQKLEEGKQ
jgi:tetratricopeptide (TPR) repeat protein